MKYSGNAISQLNYADTDKPEKLTMIENENEFFSTGRKYYWDIMRHLLDKHIPIVTALDTILGSLGELWGNAIFR